MKRQLSPDQAQKISATITWMRRLTMFGILLFLLFTAWQWLGSGQLFRTNVLQSNQDSYRSLNKLSSTTFEFTISSAGNLKLNSLPSSAARDATILGLLISSEEASLGAWQVSPPLEIIFDQPSPQDAQARELVLRFPQGHFLTTSKELGTLSFQTTTAGSIQVKQLYLGNTPSNSFPPSQLYPIYVDSFKSIEFDETGAAKIATPAVVEAPPEEPEVIDPFLSTPEEDTTSSLALDLPSTILKPNNTLVLPAAQKGLQYLFQIKTKGGKGSTSYAALGQTKLNDGSFTIGSSGLRLKANGSITGEPSSLVPGNYLIQATVRDDEKALSLSIRVAVHDEFGNPVGILVTPSFSGAIHECTLGQTCEAFFSASGGIAPYQFRFSGEQPVTGSFLQRSSSGAFYRFTPTELAEYSFSIAVTDAEQQVGSTDLTLKVSAAETSSTFRFSAEAPCDFLDLAESNPFYPSFQFTCRNQIMSGFQGNIRATDSLNRAEAAKITSLIVADQPSVDQLFAPFANQPAATSVNYQDVTVGDWYGPYVYFLFRKGIIIDNTVYRPADTLNAAEAMKLIFESYGELNSQLFDDLDALPKGTWFAGYQTIAQYLKADIGFVDPALPAQRRWIAQLLFKLFQAYPITKFK